MNKLRSLLALGVVGGAIALWIGWPEPRAERPRSQSPLSTVIELVLWEIDGQQISNDSTLEFNRLSHFQCTGTFKTDPKDWSNVADTGIRRRLKPYTKPFLKLACCSAAADGDGVAISHRRYLNHVRTNQPEIDFKGKGQSPPVPGEYELQLAVNVEPAAAKYDDRIPSEWFVIARCTAQVHETKTQ